MSAGEKIWMVQLAQGTGLCCGVDPHYKKGDPSMNEDFYTLTAMAESVAPKQYRDEAYAHMSAIDRAYTRRDDFDALRDSARFSNFAASVLAYYRYVIDIQWECGVRVFKPQSAFYERFAPYGEYMLHTVCEHIRALAKRDVVECFLILDAKREDISSTQEPYYATYLSGLDEEVFPGRNGFYGFDAMTVTTWMGEDVLTPGLPWFRKGKGAIVVTRSSNPSGTTFQDALARPCPEHVALTGKQEPFRITQGVIDNVAWRLKRPPTMCEVMLYLTDRFSYDKELNSKRDVSPIFSVIGSTVIGDGAFRRIRPGGTALIPGFGAQGGGFAQAADMIDRNGPRPGHWGILSSSRAHAFAWRKDEKYGGSGDPRNVKDDTARAIERFRADERAAYAAAGVDYPFAK